ncbi:MAG: hypothetical protein A2W25_01695 [candidate division Zixibacteria bacterium RBG_16_53_22]|nr:MAG: hypothetical protein A2W25_01695 [candidate division Zixibacteria bacterium RBG_16_53_22]
MFTSIEHFKGAWKYEMESTGKIFGALSDASLKQSVAKDHRTLGRMAWHLTQTIPEMAGRTGLKVDGPGEKEPVPTSASAIKKAYDMAAASLLEQVTRNWTDESLGIEDNMYGENWKRGSTLAALISHQIHHRAQMTVLMRQAGLAVPGIYGPSRDEWGQYNMPAPEI